jgi:hypothetical protein
VLAYVVGKGFVLAAGDSQWRIDWSRPGIVSVPLGMQLSQLVVLGGQPVRFFVNPEYNARNLYGNPHWLVRFGITILSPMKP